MRLAALVLLVLASSAGVAGETRAAPVLSKVQSDYLLACGGCHGETGVSNGRLVPDLAGQVGHFMNTAEGRAYLVRLPNVAAAALDDAALADVLNFMVWTIGGASAPPAARRFSAGEVAPLRQRPLNGVSLRALRATPVETLVSEHGAPPALRVYGESASW
ncbi:MAG: hypothetical protein ACKPE6_03380 [Gammaproteobacteria bacterium]